MILIATMTMMIANMVQGYLTVDDKFGMDECYDLV
jgi:hypothetical protein